MAEQEPPEVPEKKVNLKFLLCKTAKQGIQIISIFDLFCFGFASVAIVFGAINREKLES